MSHPKIRQPKKKEQPTARSLDVDPDILSKEFQTLDAQLAQINQIINGAVEIAKKQQAIINSAKAEGQVILGKMDMLSRILTGMGIDPRDLAAHVPVQEENSEENPPIFSEEIPKNTPQPVENIEDARIRAIKQRLNR